MKTHDKKVPEDLANNTNLVMLARTHNYPKFVACLSTAVSYSAQYVKNAGFNGLREFWKAAKKND